MDAASKSGSGAKDRRKAKKKKPNKAGTGNALKSPESSVLEKEVESASIAGDARDTRTAGKSSSKKRRREDSGDRVPGGVAGPKHPFSTEYGDHFETPLQVTLQRLCAALAVVAACVSRVLLLLAKKIWCRTSTVVNYYLYKLGRPRPTRDGNLGMREAEFFEFGPDILALDLERTCRDPKYCPRRFFCC